MSQKAITVRASYDEPGKLDELIQLSYDNFVRMERRNLLLSSSLLLVSAIVELNPTNVSISGLRFDNLSKNVYYGVLLAINLYFFVAFIVYSFPGYRNAREIRAEIIDDSGSITYGTNSLRAAFPFHMSDIQYYSWLCLHFLMPAVLGVVALVVGLIEIA